jgi:hypothetical protein
VKLVTGAIKAIETGDETDFNTVVQLIEEQKAKQSDFGIIEHFYTDGSVWKSFVQNKSSNIVDTLKNLLVDFEENKNVVNADTGIKYQIVFT